MAALPTQVSLRLGLKPPIVVEIMELSLYRFVHSKWLPIGIALGLLLFLVCFRFPFSASYFYEVSTFGLGAIVLVMAYALAQRILHPMSYLRTGLRTSLSSAFAGLALALGAISAFLMLSLLFLALLTQRFAEAALGPLVAGSIGLLANCILVGTLAIALCTPATNTIIRLAFLLWLVLALASYQATGLLGLLLVTARVPLLPFVACYSFGVTGIIGLAGVLALAAQVACVFGIIWFCQASVRIRLRSAVHRAGAS
ncbi:MAG: hypothetical protein ACLQUY_18220 [Ktedonobacterales bacterium]